MSQLRIDLRRRIADRLDQWTSDSVNLYAMVDLSEKEAADDIFAAMYFLLMRGVIAMEVDPEEFASCVRESLERMQQKRQRR
jgi:hypothetical protein